MNGQILEIVTKILEDITILLRRGPIGDCALSSKPEI